MRFSPYAGTPIQYSCLCLQKSSGRCITSKVSPVQMFLSLAYPAGCCQKIHLKNALSHTNSVVLLVQIRDVFDHLTVPVTISGKHFKAL